MRNVRKSDAEVKIIYNSLGFYTLQEYITVNTSDSCTVFEKIISPLLPLLKKEADAIKNDASTYRLSLFFFSINLLYGIVKRTKKYKAVNH